MPRKKRKNRKQPKRSISVRPIYRDKHDVERLASTLIHDALTKAHREHDSNSKP